ncbi:MAG: type II CAAX prenyl endopeptidase Rce1 family protein [Blautia sp.]
MERNVQCLFQVFLFAVYHFDGIDTSDIKKVIMMIISVEIAGIALALVTEQTGSIWSSVMIHCLYNILSGESQIFHIDVAQNFPAIWMYTVNSKNMLLTGINGSVGFTASIPTMAGFTGIILMVIYDEKKKKTYGKKL